MPILVDETVALGASSMDAEGQPDQRPNTTLQTRLFWKELDAGELKGV